eukprot:6995690-Prymnesium_polylepis.1
MSELVELVFTDDDTMYLGVPGLLQTWMFYFCLALLMVFLITWLTRMSQVTWFPRARGTCRTAHARAACTRICVTCCHNERGSRDGFRRHVAQAMALPRHVTHVAHVVVFVVTWLTRWPHLVTWLTRWPNLVTWLTRWPHLVT